MSKSEKSDAIITRRTLIAGGFGSLIWGGLISRLAYLQLMEGDEYRRIAEENRINFVPTPSLRGQIYDRFGEPLATHRQSWNMFVVSEEVDNLDDILERISNTIDLSEQRIARIRREIRLEESFVPVSIASDLTYEEFAKLSVIRHALPGVTIEAAEARSYPKGPAFAHVLGYVARASQDDIRRLTEEQAEPDNKRAFRLILKHPNMRVGRLGLERRADEWLRGQAGYTPYVKNAAGRIIRRLPNDETAPRNGRDIWLTVDSDLQDYAIERFEDQTGAAVVMDVQNGDILTLASVPTYEPNSFVNGISSKDYNALRTDERAPLYHKAYDGVYPPGSTFKMLVASAALKAGVTTPSERVFCSGRYPFGNRTFHCWKRQGHGSVNAHEAIKQSCDVYFYEIAKRLGPEAIAEEARMFGLGEVYDLGMTGGARGVVPNDGWKRATRGEQWYDGETLNYGIGQGYLTASPLQLAVMTARLASGKAIMPRLVGLGPEFETEAAPALDINEAILNRMRAGMFGVTSEERGTARAAGDLGLDGPRMAGKTGTAQVRRISAAERATGVIKNEDLPRRFRDHALFVGFAPYENPRYAVSVIVEHAGSGSRDAAPIARDIMAEAIKRDAGRTPHYASLDNSNNGQGSL